MKNMISVRNILFMGMYIIAIVASSAQAGKDGPATVERADGPRTVVGSWPVGGERAAVTPRPKVAVPSPPGSPSRRPVDGGGPDDLRLPPGVDRTSTAAGRDRKTEDDEDADVAGMKARQYAAAEELTRRCLKDVSQSGEGDPRGRMLHASPAVPAFTSLQRARLCETVTKLAEASPRNEDVAEVLCSGRPTTSEARMRPRGTTDPATPAQPTSAKGKDVSPLDDISSPGGGTFGRDCRQRSGSATDIGYSSASVASSPGGTGRALGGEEGFGVVTPETNSRVLGGIPQAADLPDVRSQSAPPTAGAGARVVGVSTCVVPRTHSSDTSFLRSPSPLLEERIRPPTPRPGEAQKVTAEQLEMAKMASPGLPQYPGYGWTSGFSPLFAIAISYEMMRKMIEEGDFDHHLAVLRRNRHLFSQQLLNVLNALEESYEREVASWNWDRWLDALGRYNLLEEIPALRALHDVALSREGGLKEFACTLIRFQEQMLSVAYVPDQEKAPTGAMVVLGVCLGYERGGDFHAFFKDISHSIPVISYVISLLYQGHFGLPIDPTAEDCSSVLLEKWTDYAGESETIEAVSEDDSRFPSHPLDHAGGYWNSLREAVAYRSDDVNAMIAIDSHEPTWAFRDKEKGASAPYVAIRELLVEARGRRMATYIARFRTAVEKMGAGSEGFLKVVEWIMRRVKNGFWV